MLMFFHWLMTCLRTFCYLFFACSTTGWGFLLCGELFHGNIANMSQHEPLGTHLPPSSSSAFRLACGEKCNNKEKMKMSTRALHPALSPSASFNPLIPLWACHYERSGFGPSPLGTASPWSHRSQVSVGGYEPIFLATQPPGSLSAALTGSPAGAEKLWVRHFLPT